MIANIHFSTIHVLAFCLTSCLFSFPLFTQMGIVPVTCNRYLDVREKKYKMRKEMYTKNNVVIFTSDEVL